jgi:hypothetical protein
MQKQRSAGLPGGVDFAAFVVFSSRGRRGQFFAQRVLPPRARNYKVKSVKRRGKLIFRFSPCVILMRDFTMPLRMFLYNTHIHTCLSDASIDQYSQHTANTLAIAFAYWSVSAYFVT